VFKLPTILLQKEMDSNMSKSRYILLIVSLLIALLSVSSVIAQEEEYVDECLAPAAEATEVAEVPDNSDISFEIILPNARGDRSFIDSAAAGAERAIAELGVEGVIIETAGSQEHDAAVRRAIQDEPNIVITIAVDSAIIQDMIDEFPDQLFGAQETFFFPEPPAVPNLALYNILTHENSYLAGIAAGMLTNTKKVGSIGGMDSAGINLFIVGFEEGVLSVCPDCQLTRGYVGDFSDPITAQAQADALYKDGYDILYQVAGRSGEGVLAAAAENGAFAIGVDSNQDDTYPGTVIVSAMKRVDNAVFGFVESVVNDTYTPGMTTVGLAEGFAGLSWDLGVCSRTFDEAGPAEMVEKLPAVRMAIADAREKILSGEIVVTNALEEAGFATE
jgi:basic membrane protein A